jgi:hypothetical protein
MAQTIGSVTQASTGITGGAPAVPAAPQPYSDRSIANFFVSQYNGRVIKSRKAKKLTQKDMQFLFKAGLRVGRARHEEEEAA